MNVFSDVVEGDQCDVSDSACVKRQERTGARSTWWFSWLYHLVHRYNASASICSILF